MGEDRRDLRMVWEELAKFEMAMEEIHLLKRVARDLKSFRKMIKLRKYD